MFVLFIGVLIAIVFDLIALVLAIVGLVSRKRWLAFPGLAFALAAIPANFFCWMVVLQGHSTRGEALTRDDWPLYAIVAGQAAVALFALAGSVRAFRRRA